MCEVTLTIPEETMTALHWTEAEAALALPMIAAVKLYETGRLSSGAAAALAGVPRTVFLERLADYGVDTFRLDAGELQADLAHA